MHPLGNFPHIDDTHQADTSPETHRCFQDSLIFKRVVHKMSVAEENKGICGTGPITSLPLKVCILYVLIRVSDGMKGTGIKSK